MKRFSPKYEKLKTRAKIKRQEFTLKKQGLKFYLPSLFKGNSVISLSMPNVPKHFSANARETLYEIIFNRRDVRGEFINKPVAEDVLARILVAAHHAPSVGFMQPWNFLLIQDDTVRKSVHGLFEKANEEAATKFEGEKQNLYQSLKLEGLLTAPLHLCITCDRDRAGPVVLGRTHMHSMDLYSTVCAVQNLWLAARAEGLGMGWVSIIKPEALTDIFKLPDSVVPVAYLCLGYVDYFRERPELEEKGWEKRAVLKDMVFSECWGKEGDEDLLSALADQQDWPLNFIISPGNVPEK